jgi:hypothetical protein
VEFEIVWAGGEGLIPPRESKVNEFWTPPTRTYNKTGKHCHRTGNKQFWADKKAGIDKPLETPETESEVATLNFHEEQTDGTAREDD